MLRPHDRRAEVLGLLVRRGLLPWRVLGLLVRRGLLPWRVLVPHHVPAGTLRRHLAVLTAPNGGAPAPAVTSR